jgi:hypothetical protein
VTVVPSASATQCRRRLKGSIGSVANAEVAVSDGQLIHITFDETGATLTDTAQSTLSWVATLQCVVKTDSSANVAEDLGEVIGRSLGQNVERKAI